MDKRRLALAVATLGVLGHIRAIGIGRKRFTVRPGTNGIFGGIVGVVLAYVLELILKSTMGNLWLLQLGAYAAVVLAISIVGVLSVPIAEEELGAQVGLDGGVVFHDQGAIIIDELVGVLIACAPLLLVPHNMAAFPLGGIAFGIFDSTKVPPARRIDQRGGPVGVILDDVVAGTYAAIVLTVLELLIWIPGVLFGVVARWLFA